MVDAMDDSADPSPASQPGAGRDPRGDRAPVPAVDGDGGEAKGGRPLDYATPPYRHPWPWALIAWVVIIISGVATMFLLVGLQLRGGVSGR